MKNAWRAGLLLAVGSVVGGCNDAQDSEPDAGPSDAGAADAAGDGTVPDAAAGDGTVPDAAAGDGTVPDAAAGDGTVPDAAADAAAPDAEKLIFVTSTMHQGNVGMLSGADEVCAARASAAGLPGTFRAWLSTVETSAADRLTQATVPYVRTDGTRVADDWSDLTDGTLQAPINRDEMGETQTGDAWTGTDSSGSFYDTDPDSDSDCVGWTSASPDGTSLCGRVSETDDRWTAILTPSCDTPLRLYCLQQ